MKNRLEAPMQLLQKDLSARSVPTTFVKVYKLYLIDNSILIMRPYLGSLKEQIEWH